MKRIPTTEVRTYAPGEKQQAFHRDPAKYRLLIGAWGSGKTTTLIWEDICLALEYPGSQGVIYRKTYPALRDTTKRDYLANCPRELIRTETRTEGREEIEFVNGSRRLFRCLDDYRKLGSTQWDVVNVDEAEEVDEEEFRTLAFGRLRGTVGPRRMVLASNPPNIDHWLYDFFVSQANADTAVHHFSTYDNQTNLPDGYLAKLETMPPMWKRKYLYGQWGVLAEGAQVFTNFRDDLHIAPLKYAAGLPLIRGWDFGFHHPACVWLQVAPTGHVAILHELLGKEEDLRHFAKRVVETTNQRFGPRTCEDYCDVAGTQKNDRGPTAVQILHNEFRIFPGYRKVGLFQSVTQINDLLERLPLGLPMLRLAPHCRLLREAFAGGYCMDKKTDLPKKDGFYEHVVDALRYGITPVLAGSVPSLYEGKPFPRRWRSAV